MINQPSRCETIRALFSSPILSRPVMTIDF